MALETRAVLASHATAFAIHFSQPVEDGGADSCSLRLEFQRNTRF